MRTSCLQDGSHVQRHTVTPSSSLLHFVQTASFGKSTTMRSSNSWTGSSTMKSTLVIESSPRDPWARTSP